MNNKGKKRTDIKYIAVLFAFIMVFSSVGILFGNVQIGNNNHNKSIPTFNNDATLESSYTIRTYLTLQYYSNGSVLIYLNNAGFISDGTSTMQAFYYNNSFNGNNGGISFTDNTVSTQTTDNIGLSSVWFVSVPQNYKPIADTYSSYTSFFYQHYGWIGAQYSTTDVNTISLSMTYVNTGSIQYNNNNNAYFYGFLNEIGQTTTMTATGSFGTAPYTYQWYNNGVAITGATSSSYSYTSTSTLGLNSFYCEVKDSAGAISYSDFILLQTVANTAVSLSSQYSSRDVGQSNIFTTTVSTNFNPVYLNYTVNGIKKTSTSSTTFTYTFATAGVHTIEVYGIDSNGYNATYTMSYTIYADPAFSALWTSNSVHTNNNIKATDVNIPIYISSNASLGSGGYSYSWSGTGVSSVNSNTLTYIPTTASATGYVITFTLTDSNGFSVSGTITIIVNNALSVVITISTTGT